MQSQSNKKQTRREIERALDKVKTPSQRIRAPIGLDRNLDTVTSPKKTPSQRIRAPIGLDRTLDTVKSPKKTPSQRIRKSTRVPSGLDKIFDTEKTPKSHRSPIRDMSSTSRHSHEQLPTKIGSGTYGCVYRPPLQCYQPRITHLHTEDVMKVMDKNNAVLEAKISKVVRHIDPKQRFFIPLSGDYCILEDHNILETTKCHSYINAKNKGDYLGYFIPYGGQSLDYYLRQRPPADVLWDWVIHLVKGLTLLHQNGIVHLDIKSANIVLQDGLPKLIDFGIAAFIKGFSSDDLRSYYEIYPLFYNMIYIKDRQDLEKVYKTYEPEIKKYDVIYKKGADSDVINLTYMVMKELGRDQYMKEIIIPNLTKIDTYMLFLMFKQVLSTYSKQYRRDNLFMYTKFLAIVATCTNPNYMVQQDLNDIKVHLTYP